MGGSLATAGAAEDVRAADRPQPAPKFVPLRHNLPAQLLSVTVGGMQGKIRFLPYADVDHRLLTAEVPAFPLPGGIARGPQQFKQEFRGDASPQPFRLVFNGDEFKIISLLSGNSVC